MLASAQPNVTSKDEVVEPTDPQRRCLASGEVRSKAELLRFVVAPDGTLTPDLGERLPGRGLWIAPDRTLLRKALRRGLFSRSARRPVLIPDDLEVRIGRLLRQRCLDLLGLARRAGAAVAGHDKVRILLEQGEAGLLLQARDGSPAQRRRIAALGRGHCPGLRVVDVFTASELGAALGRAHAVHVALRRGGATERLVRDLARLETYETGEAESAASARR